MEKSAYVVSQVKGHELAEPELVKQDGQCHQLGQLQSGLATSMFLSIVQQTLVPGRFEFHAGWCFLPLSGARCPDLREEWKTLRGFREPTINRPTLGACQVVPSSWR